VGLSELQEATYVLTRGPQGLLRMVLTGELSLPTAANMVRYAPEMVRKFVAGEMVDW